MTSTVEVEVQVSHLLLGGREGHMEEKMYRKGDKFIIPLSLAMALGSSVRIIEKPVEKPVIIPKVESEEEVLPRMPETNTVIPNTDEKEKPKSPKKSSKRA